MKLDKVIKKHKQEAYEKAQKYFSASVQCQMVCGDGSGKPVTKHLDNCPVLAVKL